MISKILKLLSRKNDIDLKNLKLNAVKSILVVKQHNQLGDLLCTLPMIYLLKKEYPSSEITLLVSKKNISGITIENIKFLDKILFYEKNSLTKTIKLLITLRKKKYEIGIVPSTFSISLTSHLINYLSGAKIRIGVNSINHSINKYSFLLNYKKDFNWHNKRQHHVKRNIDIIKDIIKNNNENEISNARLKLKEQDIQFANNFVKTYFKNEKYLFAFHPGAGKRQNRWSSNNFLKLIELLKSNYKCNILITSGPLDVEPVSELEKLLTKSNIKFKTLPSETEIMKLAAVVKLCDLYVTNDTGTMHVAWFVNAKTLGLFGPTKNYEWEPLNKDGYSIQSKTDDINDLTPEEVFDKIIKIININNNKTNE